MAQLDNRPHPATARWLKKRKKKLKGKKKKAKKPHPKSKKRKSGINFSNYTKGERWKLFKQKQFQMYPKCIVCGREDNLVVHHNSYKNLGFKEEFDDVVTMCKHHHIELHDFCSVKELSISKGSIAYFESVGVI